MTRISKPKRARGPVKRIDLTDMRELFRDRRMWSAIGVVTAPDEGAPHWEIVQSDDGNGVDVLVEVVLMPSEEPATCRLPGGVFDVPDEGDEVGVIMPEGDRAFMPVIVCRLSRSVPSVQGPQPGRIAIIRDEVVVHDGNGGAVSLARKQDVINVDNKYADHIHLDGSNLPTSEPGGAPIPNPGTPPPAFVGVTPLAAAEILGTNVLKGK